MDSKGFSIVELVLVLVIVGLLGVVGWFVVNSKNSVDKTPEAAVDNTNSPTKDETKTEPTAQWLQYISQNNKYSMAIPDGWHLVSGVGQDDLYATNEKDITFQEGTKAKVDISDAGAGHMVFWFIYDYKNSGHFDFSDRMESATEKTYTTGNSVSVRKYSRTETIGKDTVEKGTVQYTYDISKDNIAAAVIYDVRPGEADQSKYIEDALTTLKFL